MVAGRAPEEGDHAFGPTLLLLSPLAAVVDLVGVDACTPVHAPLCQHQPGGAPCAAPAAVLPVHTTRPEPWLEGELVGAMR